MTKPRAAIYVRVSQDRDGVSAATDRQAKDCNALARREGLAVVEVYEDRDASAYSGKRPGFEQMLDELERFDVLIYWKNDRLARRIKDFWRVVDACDTAGVRLVSVVDPIDTSSPIGKGIAGMVAAMAEQESANTGLRIARAHEDAARAGRAHGGRRAYGYAKDMTIVPAEADAIREARDRILSGVSMTAICADWNRRGIRPAASPAWRLTCFKRMIVGAHLAGLRVFRGEVVGEGDWEPILSVDDHRRLVARLDDPTLTHRGRPAASLLTGFMRCGACGAKMQSASAKTVRIWACRGLPGVDTHCGRRSITADRTSRVVELAILARLDSPALAKARQRAGQPTKKTDAPTVATMEEQVTQLGFDHDEGLITRAEWLERRARLLPRLDAARADIARENGTTPLAGFAPGHAHDRWAALGLAERRAVVGALIESVTIDAANGTKFDGRRIKIAWKT